MSSSQPHTYQGASTDAEISVAFLQKYGYIIARGVPHDIRMAWAALTTEKQGLETKYEECRTRIRTDKRMIRESEDGKEFFERVQAYRAVRDRFVELRIQAVRSKYDAVAEHMVELEYDLVRRGVPTVLDEQMRLMEACFADMPAYKRTQDDILYPLDNAAAVTQKLEAQYKCKKKLEADIFNMNIRANEGVKRLENLVGPINRGYFDEGGEWYSAVQTHRCLVDEIERLLPDIPDTEEDVLALEVWCGKGVY